MLQFINTENNKYLYKNTKFNKPIIIEYKYSRVTLLTKKNINMIF